jgi:hypothetical protein
VLADSAYGSSTVVMAETQACLASGINAFREPFLNRCVGANVFSRALMRCTIMFDEGR